MNIELGISSFGETTPLETTRNHSCRQIEY